ncbi:hypothetical protein [Actinophytocola sp.]|uniref:hypothetical protein n=1 Tax=Actinophytocola sp. TaxID=1872138 RepID=UPI00389A129C
MPAPDETMGVPEPTTEDQSEKPIRSPWRRAVVVVVLIIVVVIGQRHGWWAVFGLWWDEKLKPDQLTLGITLHVWGRIGKMLQFLAGLTVVLDIIGPEKLAQAARLREKRSKDTLSGVDDALQLQPFANLWEDVFRGLIDQEPIPPPGDGFRLVLATGRPPEIGSVAGLGQAEFETWLQTTRRALRRSHSCAPHGDRACPEQYRFARAETDSFLRSWLSEADLARYERATAASIEMDNTQHLLQIWTIILAGAQFLFLPLVVAGVLAGPLVALCLLAPPLVEDPTGFRLALWVRLGPSILLNQAAAAFLHRTTKKGLRWTAVTMFVTGFTLDLLSS